MLHAGLDLSRKKIDICLLSEGGEHLDQLAFPPDVDSLRRLARRIDEVHAEPVCAVIESMTGLGRSTTPSRSRAGRWRSPMPPRSRASPPWPARPTRSTRGCWRCSASADPVPAAWLPDPRVRE